MPLVTAATILKTLSVSKLLLEFVLLISLEIPFFELCKVL